ncbi:MAG: MarR family winged helix-turn-helix transcriptional regulator [Cellvibrionaceae bacterium]
MANETEYSAIIKALWVNSAIFSKQLDNSLGAIHGIGLTEYMVLLNLSQAPNKELRRIDIAEALARTASGITRMLMPMEKIGLVAKASSARDARVSLVKLTAAGERLFVDATITLEEKSKKLLKNLDGKNATHLLSLLDAL